MLNPFKVYISLDSNSSECVFERKIEDREKLSCRKFAREWADLYCMALSDDRGHVPLGCAHFTVEISEHDFNSGSNWNAESFFLASE